MRRLVSSKDWQRYAAVAIGLLIVGAVSAPASIPARGAGASTLAVQKFENAAGAPSGVVSDLSNALYQGVASSGKYDVKGGGPLAYGNTLTGDPFMEGIASGAKVGADELLVGSIVQMTGGQVFYRLSLYRIAPLTFIRTQVFSQAYPPGDAHALSAGFAGNVATLSAPRQGVGTVYSLTDGVRADLGTSEGFSLGDRFNVMRGGQKVAEATISSIRDADATVTISNASSGYSPKIGDTLVGQAAMPPVAPAPPNRSTFNPIGFLVAVGGALLAIGHHGQPGTQCFSCGGSPAPSSSPFVLLSAIATGTVPAETIAFTFNNVFNAATTTGVQGNSAYASYSLCPLPCSGATTPPAPMSNLGSTSVTTITGTGGAQESQLTVGTTQPGLVSGEPITFFFTTLVTDQFGVSLAMTTVPGTLSGSRKPFTTTRPKPVGPVAPGPGKPVRPKPAVPPKAPPDNPKPRPGIPQ